MGRDVILDWPQGWSPRSFPYRDGFHSGVSLIPTEGPHAVRRLEFDIRQGGFEYGKSKERREDKS